MILIIHGDVSSARLRQALIGVTEVCLFEGVNIEEVLAEMALSPKMTKITKEDWDAACDEVRHQYVNRAVEQIKKEKCPVFTNAYCARSEYSKAIEAFVLCYLIERHFPDSEKIRIVSSNTCVGYALNYVRGLTLKNTRFVLLEIITCIVRCSVQAIKLTWNFLLLKVWFFTRGQSLSQDASQGSCQLAVGSVIRHWGEGGDWRYGTDFNAQRDVFYFVSVFSAGSIQPVSLWQSKTAHLISSLKRVSIVETWISSRVLLRILVVWGLRVLNAGFQAIFLLKKWKIQSATTTDKLFNFVFTLESLRSLHEWGSLALVDSGANAFFKKVRPTTVLSYHFEYGFGRALFSAAHRNGIPDTIGFQHGLVSPGKWCYSLDCLLAANADLKELTPTTLAIEGEVVKRLLVTWGRDERRLKVIGAVRMDGFSHQAASTRRSFPMRPRVGMIVMDLHCTLSDLEFYMQSLDSAEIKADEVWLRPHPRDLGSTEKAHSLQAKFPGLKIHLSRGLLLADVKKIRPELIVGSASNALFECVILGATVHFLSSPGSIDLNPLRHFGGYIRTASVHDSILRELYFVGAETASSRLAILASGEGRLNQDIAATPSAITL